MRANGRVATAHGEDASMRRIPLLLLLGVAVLAAVVAMVVSPGGAVASPSGPGNYSGVSPESHGLPAPAAVYKALGAAPVLPRAAGPAVSASAAGSISGKVTNSAGTGLGNVFVYVWDESFNILATVQTASNGNYSITGLPNQRVAVCTANDLNYIDEWYNNVQLAGNWDATNATWFDLGTTPTRTGINFSLALGKSISGYVRDTYANALADEEVDAYDFSGSLMASGWTDGSGAYFIRGLPAGQYLVRTANDLGYVDEWYDNDPVISDPSAASATAVNVTSSNATGKDFALDMGRIIAGHVDSISAALSDVQVRVQPTSRNGGAMWATTDSLGNYQISSLPPGTYIANTANNIGYVDEWYDNHVAPGDLTGASANPIDVTSADQLSINFRLESGHDIGGQVTDYSGGPLAEPGLFVEVFDAAGTMYAWNHVGGADGTSYSTWALPPGTYYAATVDYYGAPYTQEWYDNKRCGEFDLAGADPIDLSAQSAPNIDFALNRMTHAEQGDLHLLWAGSWNTASNSLYSGGSIAYANSSASVTISFSGVKLNLIGTFAPSYGKMNVTLDGTTTSTVDLYSKTASYRQTLWSSGVLSLATHSVKVEWTGTSNASASNTMISLDAVEVSGNLTYSQPTITSINPTSGSTTGGTSVVITGTGFAGLVGPTAVTFGGANATTYHVDSSTQITAASPAGVAGTVDVVVTAAGGTSATSAADQFTYMVPPPAPTVTAVAPTSGPTTGQTGVIITGTNLTGASAVTFGGTAALGYTVDSETQIMAIAPAHAAGAVDVRVTTLGGTSPTGSADKFTYVSAPTTTRTEQTSGTFTWTGSWTLGSISSASGGSLKLMNSAGSVTIPFTGTYLAWISAKAATYGVAKVTVDGTRTYTVNLFSATTTWKQMVFNTGILASGAHTVKIEWTGTKGISTGNSYIGLDAVDIAGPAAPPTTRLQDDNSALSYTGSWTQGKTTLASGGSLELLNSAGTVYLTFTGTRVSWISPKAATYGQASVSVDEGTPETVDLYSATTKWQQTVWSKTFVDSGTHAVAITWTGNKNAAAANTYIGVDALDIVGTVAGPPTTRLQDDNSALTYTGSWTQGKTSLASGGSVGLLNSAGSVSLTFSGTHVNWISAMAATYGKASVTVDGGDPDTVDLYSLTTKWQQTVWSKSLVDSGTHTVTISWTGQKNAAATNTYIGLDALDIVGTVGGP
jgi:hypothetical protein